ncbi:thioredoxin family protein [Mesorhizobium sp. M1396]|uniref:thioredoxin family protein n=1 Tax=Mesorhizobium sp. M1396 TaxID=2957095 RepID=UPI00333BEA8E
MAFSSPVCDFGLSAADATLSGLDGKPHRVLDSAGPRGLVVAFICNHCPYVRAVIGRIVRDARDLRQFGVGFVAINANDAKIYRQDSFPNMKLFAREHRFDFPYLHDADQVAARAYGATCTPDFFGFNAELKLQYRGRLDASRKEEGPPGLRRDLYQAMTQIANCGYGPDEQIASVGCSIKWRTGL